MSEPSIWLFRHGATEWSDALRHTGRTDIPLTAEGERQARDLAQRVAGTAFSLVLVSPLQRARETCRLAGLDDGAVVEADLLEWDYGDAEGRTTAQIREERPGWTVWTGPVPGGETAAQVGARTDRVIARAVQAEGDVALFAHAHVLRILTARWLGLEAVGGALFHLDPGTVSVLGHERETRVLQRWNA